MGMLLPHRDVSVGTSLTTTKTRKTTKMPREYRAYAKMPKGWKMEEVVDDEVEEVWESVALSPHACLT